MRCADGWRDLARPTIVAGSLLAAHVAFEARTGGVHLQRAAVVVFPSGVVTLALRVQALAASPAVGASASR